MNIYIYIYIFISTEYVDEFAQRIQLFDSLHDQTFESYTALSTGNTTTVYISLHALLVF